MHRLLALSLLVAGAMESAQSAQPAGDSSAVVPVLSSSATLASVRSAPAEFSERPVVSWQEAQIALARRGFSSGPIDGIPGAQTEAALRAFQKSARLPVTGQLDTATCAGLVLNAPPFEQIALSVADFAALQPLSRTWLAKSQQTALGYESALEWAAERSRAHPALIRQLNPDIDWGRVLPGARFTVPAIARVTLPVKAAQLHVRLAAHVLQALDDHGKIIAHFPVSIARRVEKRPEGELRVTVVIPEPDYTFDPEVFPESDEGRELGRRLRLPPGPNNPVGVAWIGLDRPGYGIHGTPTPGHVGRTESHGCFRLANWDALTLIDLAWVGLPVVVDP